MTPGAQARRAAIVQALEAQPGLSFRGVVRATGIPAGTARHHLNVLVRRKRVWYQQVGVRLVHFAGRRPDTEPEQREALCATFDKMDAKIYLAVRDEGPLIQRDIISRFPAEPTSTVQHRVKRLVRIGILDERASGRCRSYVVAAAHAVA